MREKLAGLDKVNLVTSRILVFLLLSLRMFEVNQDLNAAKQEESEGDGRKD